VGSVFSVIISRKEPRDLATEGVPRVPVYTVTKPAATKDSEFEAYTRLLEDVGIDVSTSPRVPKPGTDRRWLYARKKKIEAERFADELRHRTGDPDWKVYQFEDAPEDCGPVARGSRQNPYVRCYKNTQRFEFV
jgi:hypothetical protein